MNHTKQTDLIAYAEGDVAGAGTLDLMADDTILTVNIDQIKPYDHNPRLLQNPKWQEIEESIRASGGLTDTLSVTKRPGDDTYIIHQGGNTRLLILQKLFAETADDAFRRVRVDVQPYTNELDLSAFHDRENNCRGDLTYFEQAWSKYRQYELYCKAGHGKPAATAFAKFLTKNYGDTMSAETFSRMKFSVEILYQHIPTCLVQGAMSLRSVRYLIQTRSSLEQVWMARKIGSKADFQIVFYDLLARQDKDLAQTFVSADRHPASYPDPRIAIDWSLFRDDLSHELTIIADVDHQRAAAWIAPAFRSGTTHVVSAGAQPPSSAASSHQDPHKPIGQPSPLDLRTEALQIARKIADSSNLLDCIIPTPNEGFGYQLNPVPDGNLLSVQESACWSVLALSSMSSGTLSTVPSISALLPRQILLWSKLLGVQARLAKEVGSTAGLWSE